MKEKPDLHGYVLGELPAAERAAVEEAIAADRDLAIEMERLAASGTALRGMSEEEPPRRIAFVSDRVFEPKWWQIWLHGKLGFASAAMLAAALVIHGIATGPSPVPAPVTVDAAAIETRVQEEVDKRLTPAVAKAVAEMEARQQQVLQAALKDVEKRYAEDRRMLMISMQDNFELLRKQFNTVVLARNYGGD